MDSNYFFIQKQDTRWNQLIDIFMHDINADSDNDLSDTFVNEMGIYKVIPSRWQ